MFKLFVVLALIAVAVAAPRPGLSVVHSSPLVHEVHAVHTPVAVSHSSSHVVHHTPVVKTVAVHAPAHVVAVHASAPVVAVHATPLVKHVVHTPVVHHAPLLKTVAVAHPHVVSHQVVAVHH